MAGIKSIDWKKFEKFLLFVGCKLSRGKGDHRIYHRYGLSRPIVIPKDKHIPVFVIRNNLRLLNISVSEYVEIIERRK